MLLMKDMNLELGCDGERRLGGDLGTLREGARLGKERLRSAGPSPSCLFC